MFIDIIGITMIRVFVLSVNDIFNQKFCSNQKPTKELFCCISDFVKKTVYYYFRFFCFVCSKSVKNNRRDLTFSGNSGDFRVINKYSK